MPDNFKTILVVFILMLFAAWGGFIAGRLYKGDIKFIPLQSQINNSADAPGNLFSRRTAYIRGKITGVNGNKISVINLNGKTGEIVASPNILISQQNLTTGTKTASTSANLSQAELNTEVLITLEYLNSNYQAVFINYLPSAPPPITNPIQPVKTTN